MEITISLILVVAITVGALFAASRADQNRTTKLAAVAADMGFTFSSQPIDELRRKTADLHLFSYGYAHETRNILHGSVDELAVLVFDHHYRLGGGQGPGTYKQTVLLLESEDLSLPTFTLRPEIVFEKLGQAFGDEDIDFETNPAFSQRFALRGDHSGEVRARFTGDVLSHFVTRRNIATEAQGKLLVYYRPKRLIAPQAVREFIADGVEVVKMLRR